METAGSQFPQRRLLLDHLVSYSHLLDTEGLEKPAVAEIEIGALVRYERPEPVMTGYDQLLKKVQA